MGRSPCCSSKEGLNRGAWTAVEDEILVSYISSHGEGKWRSLPRKAGLNRCGKSCRQRWLNYLRPDIKRGNISEQEEDLIIRLHKLLGNRWSLIAGRLPGRTGNEIKNYWNTILRRKVHGRPSGAPWPKRATEDRQRTRPEKKVLLARTSPSPPALPKESAEDATGADIMISSSEDVVHRDWQLDAPCNGGQTPSLATSKAPLGSDEASQQLGSSRPNDSFMDHGLFEDMHTMSPPADSSSIFLAAADGRAEEAAKGSRRELSIAHGLEDILFDGAMLEDWLKADVPKSEFPSDFKFVASFLNRDEWQ